MTDYVKGLNFTAYRGQDADPAVFDTEFSAVANSSATKMDKTGGTFTGPISVPAGATGTQAMQAQEILAIIPAGTVMAFFQAAAPVGWTQVTTQNDAIMRVVNTTGGGAGGTTGFATAPLAATDPHTLTIAEMPAHTHDFTAVIQTGGSYLAYSNTGGQKTGTTTSTGGNTGHSHTITWTPKYIDMILASKN